MRSVIILATAALTACSVTLRNDPPAATFTASTGLDETATCLVRALNEDNPRALLPGPHLTHQVQIVEPGRVYEVLPQKTIVVGGEVYFIRATALPSGGTQIEPFAIGTWRGVKEAAESCAG